MSAILKYVAMAFPVGGGTPPVVGMLYVNGNPVADLSATLILADNYVLTTNGLPVTVTGEVQGTGAVSIGTVDSPANIKFTAVDNALSINVVAGSTADFRGLGLVGTTQITKEAGATVFLDATLEYLAVGAGAGSGGGINSVVYNAGGGGGEVLTGTAAFAQYAVSIGAGSLGAHNGNPANGGNTVFGELTARGGIAPTTTPNAGKGGASGNGNAGAVRVNYASGGGGGAGGAATGVGMSNGRTGHGLGVISSITGTAIEYGKGGDGSLDSAVYDGAANTGEGGKERGRGSDGGVFIAYRTLAGSAPVIVGATGVTDTVSRHGFTVVKITAGTGTITVS